MRFTSICGRGILSLTLLGVSMSGTNSWAQAVATPVVKHTVKGTAIKQLHAAHKLLKEADHDYDGHRARAAEEIHKAIKEIEGSHHAKKAHEGVVAAKPEKVKTEKVKHNGPHEPQAVSDAQLREALGLLQSVQAELKTHHPKAEANIAAAIAELNTALAIK